MFKVADFHQVTLSSQLFKSGRTLPDNRDYSTLIQMGVVVEVADREPQYPVNEPSIVTITRNKVQRAKNEQADAKNNRIAAKKKASSKKKVSSKKKKFTVEIGG